MTYLSERKKNFEAVVLSLDFINGRAKVGLTCEYVPDAIVIQLPLNQPLAMSSN